MKQRGLVAAVFAAVLVTGITVAVVAQPQVGPDGPRQGMRRGGPGGPMGGPGGVGLPGLRQLELSDAQKEQIKTITQSHRDEMRQVAQRTREAQRGMDAAAEGTSVDESSIRASSTALAAALADGAILRAKINAEIFGILTPDQQQKLAELRTQREQRMKAAPRRQRGAR
jgi:Spy/CpxP family protein refolding chaperone